MAVLAILPTLANAEIFLVYKILAYCSTSILLNKKIAVAVQYIIEHYLQSVFAIASKPTRLMVKSWDIELLRYSLK